MSKFRKKPIIVEAEQFFVNKLSLFPDVRVEEWIHPHKGDECTSYIINTHYGTSFLHNGDWIITEEGKNFILSEKEFEKEYEKIEE